MNFAIRSRSLDKSAERSNLLPQYSTDQHVYFYVLFLVIVLNIHHKHTVSDVIPRWASYIIFVFLPKWIFIQGPVKSKSHHACSEVKQDKRESEHEETTSDVQVSY